jgi:hypothetical protein
MIEAPVFAKLYPSFLYQKETLLYKQLLAKSRRLYKAENNLLLLLLLLLVVVVVVMMMCVCACVCVCM